ncbi:MAG: hypothetical protein M1480_01915 [Bacteroidetes bacterium]|nr:hypothetical protein [Bacteroidota bacterium]
MKNIISTKIGAFILSLIFLSSSLFCQSNEEQKNQRHQAVKDFMNRVWSSPEYKKANQLYRNINQSSLPKKYDYEKIGKISGLADRKHYFMNGNKIATEVYNYGGIAPGYGLLRGVNNVVWRNIDYVYQFCPLVGVSVPDSRNPKNRIHIISDGLNDYPSYREVSPDGKLWQWEPIPGYADPNQEYMASNPAQDLDNDGKPDSWPRGWYNPTLGKYVWPGYLSQDASNAEQEVFWAMDDRDNDEFSYYPFNTDTTRRGIGVQVEGRAFQWSNALAENAIFFVYTITNVSDQDLDTVFFGIYGDPDVGGASPFNTNNLGFFIPPYASDGSVDKIPVYARSLVYFWNTTGTGQRGVKTGYIGCKFLESPGNPNDGIDNDGDGIIDERQDDGIDNDHDWNPLTDDVGIDGIPNTGDQGEGDGVPTAGIRLPDGSLDPLHPGEPNFELTDLDEADQIGLTSFNSWVWASDKISNDESMWSRSIPGNFTQIQSTPADLVFIFGSGYISLKKGETKRISMALLLGEDLDDLLTTAETVQTIYNQNYRFFKPPITPKVTAVAGDKKVTLYWDSNAEQSIDPITGKDFEGYVIYRSLSPDFNDIQKVTDGQGSSFLCEPLKDINGFDAKWDVDFRDEPFTDLNGNGKYDSGEPFVDWNKDGVWTAHAEDPWKGYHPVAYQGRGLHYYLGNNSGLVHSFVDSNKVENGQTYYYSVVAYDHGDSLGIPPTETTKNITVDPITSKLRFDPNTVQVIPGPRSSGYIAPDFSDNNLIHDSGIGTGTITTKILNDLTIPNGGDYKIIFSDSLLIQGKMAALKNYSVLRNSPETETFPLYDTNFTTLKHSNIYPSSVIVSEINSDVAYLEGHDYVLNYDRGTIRRTSISSIPNNKTYSITYKYYPVANSTKFDLEDGNPVFDGIMLKVKDETILEVDTIKSRWVEGNTNYNFVVQKGTIGAGKFYPADYEIKFSSHNIDSATMQTAKGPLTIPVKYSVRDITTNEPIKTFLKENLSTRDSAWSPGEEIILFQPGAKGLPTELTWGVVISAPTDSTVIPRLPTDGDVLLIATKRPFNGSDEFSFKTAAAKYNQQTAVSGLDKVYVVPNPYVGLSDIEPTTKLPGQTRGERRIYFENLPPKCTIRIFTLSGDYVKTIEHDGTIANGREFWNLLNTDGFSVAYGIYFAHIDAPGVGEKIIKFALIK